MRATPIVACLFAAALSLGTATVRAQTYPDKPIKILVGFAAGGSTDLVTRAVAQSLEATLKQPVVIENRLGASGTVATQALALSAPDGYTLGACSTSAFTILPDLMKSIKYNPVKDFQPIAQFGLAPYVLVANPQLGVSTLQDVIKLAKSKPGGLTYASGGVGSASHLTGELFAATTGVKLTHIPYKGLAEAMTDVIGGQVDLAFDQEASAGGNIRAKRLRPIAIASAARSPTLTDVPTFAQAGVPLQAAQWIGLCGPAGMAPERVATLARSVGTALQQSEVTKRFEQLGVQPVLLNPSDFAKAIDADRAQWRQLITKNHISIE